MEPNEIALSLRGAATKWEATHPIIGVGQLRVHDALNDAADCIEKLQAELKAPQRRVDELFSNNQEHSAVLESALIELGKSQRRERAAVEILNSIEWVGSGAKGRIEDAINVLQSAEQEWE